MSTPEAVLSFLFGRLPSGLVLNLGAGSTSFADGDHVVVGVDIEPPRGSHALFVLADASALPFRDRTFSGALLKDIIEHVADPIAALREVRRVGVADAQLLLTTPRAIPRAVWADPTHIRGFTAKALSMLADRAGWRLTYGPRRIGSVPGAGRFGLVPYLETMLRIPGFGHWFGTNWIVGAIPS